jgi:hypothetical protein
MMLSEPVECECCKRPVVWDKLPGIGYYCDPCIKCFGADPPLTGDEPLPAGVTCYFVDDLAWMQHIQRSALELRRHYAERARAKDAP